jgi:uncharacterized membrane protein YeiH
LPWYAIVGVQTAMAAHLGYAAAVLIGIIATTAGRWIIDVACNCVPKQLVRGEFFVGAAALTGITYLVCDQVFVLPAIVSTTISFFVGFGFRLLSQYLGWEEWEPWDPAQVAQAKRDTLGQGLESEFKH